jgi:hypothetical protein
MLLNAHDLKVIDKALGWRPRQFRELTFLERTCAVMIMALILMSLLLDFGFGHSIKPAVPGGGDLAEDASSSLAGPTRAAP